MDNSRVSFRFASTLEPDWIATEQLSEKHECLTEKNNEEKYKSVPI
jgi:hypothetical protein